LGENETFPVIISSKLNAHQEGELLQTLKMHKNTLGWTIVAHFTSKSEFDLAWIVSVLYAEKPIDL